MLFSDFRMCATLKPACMENRVLCCRSLIEHLTKYMKALGAILAPQKSILLDTEFLFAVSDLLNLLVQLVLVWMLGLLACAT